MLDKFNPFKKKEEPKKAAPKRKKSEKELAGAFGLGGEIRKAKNIGSC